ncbi:CatB-related O-acetyltransferase [Flavobacterium hibernum]|uniref:CatB-related O-acetyltransferase n=1 Tax=Flavobacterium hibernum TaxID=37752 RepID=UPI000B08DA0E|nr:CatB-related O-acetyltransferase [Flavobacterium hibernum]STO13898.1 Streptogramin A acetyltransferase [Flavobacterium hibernum]
MKKILISIYLFIENLSKKEHNPSIDQIIKLCNKDVYIGRYTYGFESTQIYTWGEEIDITIGRFCSIGAGLRLFCGGNHSTWFASSYPFGSVYPNYLKTKVFKSIVFSNGKISIGNDVWLGRDVTVMSGITIGDGSVVAANSHVVKDIEPYSIYGGNPAKFIRYRFSSEIIEMLLELKWWNYDDSIIEKIYPLLLEAPDANIYNEILLIIEKKKFN